MLDRPLIASQLHKSHLRSLAAYGEDIRAVSFLNHKFSLLPLLHNQATLL